MKITIINNILNFRGVDYNFSRFEYVDDNCFHVVTSKNVFCFLFSETEINGKVYNNFDELSNDFL